MPKVYKHTSCWEYNTTARELLGLSIEDSITTDTFRDLLLANGLTKSMNRVIGQLILEENLWDDALQLSRSGEPQVAFRASWALEWAYIADNSQIEARADTFIEDLLDSSNQSVQRVYSKMVCDMLRRGSVVLTDNKATDIVDKCFSLLTDDNTPVAVKVWQIELLCDFTTRFDWIEENLTAIVRNLSEHPDCSPAMAAHSRRYLQKIARKRFK